MNTLTTCIICTKSQNPFQICKRCSKSICKPCTKTYSLQTKKKTSCINCQILIQNPSVEIVQNLSNLILKKSSKEKDKIFLFLSNFSKKSKNIKNIEIRCLKLDSRGKKIIGENTWPDNYKLFLNNSSQLLTSDVKVQKSSSINKRKDKSFVILFKDFVRKIGNIEKPFFMIEYENVFDDKNSFFKDRDIIYYELIVLGTRETNFKHFLNSRFVLEFEKSQSLEFIKKLFGGSLVKKDDIIIDELKMDLICKLTYTKMNFPSRGNNCDHLNCFSLKSFYFTLQASEYKKLYCPICKNPIQFFCYDKLIEKIIDDSNEEKEIVSFNNYGDFEKIAILNKKKKNGKIFERVNKKEILILTSDDENKEARKKVNHETDKFLEEILNDDKKYEEICQFFMMKLMIKNCSLNLDKDNTENCKYFNLNNK